MQEQKNTLFYAEKAGQYCLLKLGFNIRASMDVESSVAKRAVNWRVCELVKCTDMSKK